MVEVINIRKTKSKFDFVHRGKILHFQIDPCENGVHVFFFFEQKMKDVIPEPLQNLLPDNDLEKILKKKVIEEHISLTWYDKLLGRTLEKKITSWARKTQKQCQKSEDVVKKIRENLTV